MSECCKFILWGTSFSGILITIIITIIIIIIIIIIITITIIIIIIVIVSYHVQQRTNFFHKFTAFFAAVMYIHRQSAYLLGRQKHVCLNTLVNYRLYNPM